MSSRSLVCTTAALLLTAAATAPARAQNLLPNPGFESGLTGWKTVQLGPPAAFFPPISTGACPVALTSASGTCAILSATAGNPGSSEVQSQAGLFTAGAQYHASVIVSPFDAATGLSVRFGAFFQIGQSSDGPSAIVTSCAISTGCTLALDFTAPAATGYLSIGGGRGLNGPVPAATLYFDNVTLTQTATAAPEPATLALLLPGLVGLGAVVRRRRA